MLMTLPTFGTGRLGAIRQTTATFEDDSGVTIDPIQRPSAMIPTPSLVAPEPIATIPIETIISAPDPIAGPSIPSIQIDQVPDSFRPVNVATFEDETGNLTTTAPPEPISTIYVSPAMPHGVITPSGQGTTVAIRDTGSLSLIGPGDDFGPVAPIHSVIPGIRGGYIPTPTPILKPSSQEDTYVSVGATGPAYIPIAPSSSVGVSTFGTSQAFNPSPVTAVPTQIPVSQPNQAATVTAQKDGPPWLLIGAAALAAFALLRR